jgi:hypothetical protein
MLFSRISTRTQNAEPARAINHRLGRPRIFVAGSGNNIFDQAMPAIANMNMISMFSPIRIR